MTINGTIADTLQNILPKNSLCMKDNYMFYVINSRTIE